MTQVINIKAMEGRQREIRSQIESLEAEYAEISSAIRVVMRFATSAEEVTSDVTAKLGPARPHDIPTNHEMALTVLHDAVESGKAGLTAAEMVEEIGKRWWPGVQRPQILPIMYQFAKKGRLVKGDDGYFRLPTTAEMNEASADAEASTNPSRSEDPSDQR